jgi:hypothetical protein
MTKSLLHVICLSLCVEANRNVHDVNVVRVTLLACGSFFFLGLLDQLFHQPPTKPS